MRVRIQTVALSILLASGLAVGSGCALGRGTTQAVSVYSSAPDTKVIINGNPAGSTRAPSIPLVLTLRRDNNYVVAGSKDGYKSNTVVIDSKISGIGIVDAVGAYLILIPGISVINGSAMTLTPSEVHLVLEPVSEESSSAGRVTAETSTSVEGTERGSNAALRQSPPHPESREEMK
jgi:hypothetical protein